jgi:hypothetical protein
LSIEKTFSSLPGWKFTVEEASAGIYRMSATDNSGRRLEISGTNVEDLLERVRISALEMTDAL